MCGGHAEASADAPRAAECAAARARRRGPIASPHVQPRANATTRAGRRLDVAPRPSCGLHSRATPGINGDTGLARDSHVQRHGVLSLPPCASRQCVPSTPHTDTHACARGTRTHTAHGYTWYMDTHGRMHAHTWHTHTRTTHTLRFSLGQTVFKAETNPVKLPGNVKYFLKCFEIFSPHNLGS